MITGQNAIAKCFGILALIAFWLSATIHLLTYVPGFGTFASPVFALLMLPFCAMFPAFFAMILAISFARNQAAKLNLPSDSASMVIQNIPVPVVLLVIGVAINMLINSAVFFSANEGGSPAKKDGGFYLHSHGKKIRDITEAEYTQIQAYSVRCFTSFHMLFTLIPMTYFLYVFPRSAWLRT